MNVDSFGNITLNGVAANQNNSPGAYGVYLDNSDGSGTVSVLATLGVNDFGSNYQDGLKVISKGAVAD